MWSMHYFFFNKEKKRVCYLYLRGMSVLSRSPVQALGYLERPSLAPRKASSVSFGQGAGKRASYWLGDRVSHDEIETEGYADDDDDEMVIPEPNDDEVDVPYMDLDEVRRYAVEGIYPYDVDDMDEDVWEEGFRPIWGMRGVSEEVAERIEL